MLVSSILKIEILVTMVHYLYYVDRVYRSDMIYYLLFIVQKLSLSCSC